MGLKLCAPLEMYEKYDTHNNKYSKHTDKKAANNHCYGQHRGFLSHFLKAT